MKIVHVLVVHSVDPERLFTSIPTDTYWQVHFHGSDELLADKVESLVSERAGHFFRHMSNRGLSKSWNDAIIAAVTGGFDAVMLLNDDLYFLEDCYEMFVRNLITDDESIGISTLNGLERNTESGLDEVQTQGYACAVLHPGAIQKVGLFDEAFWPAYFEDVDYTKRLKLAGLRMHVDQRVLVRHDRSSTLRLSPDARHTVGLHHGQNLVYCQTKWGSLDTDNGYDFPFNNNAHSFYISEHDRADPYGRLTQM